MRRIDIAGQAFRNIRRQKLRSILTIFAIVIGATSVTIMLALVTGAKTFFLSQFEASGQLQQVVVTQATDLDFKQAAQGGGGGGPQATGTPLTDALATKIESFSHVIGLARTTNIGDFEALSYGGSKLTIQQVQAYDATGVVTQSLLAGRQLQSSDATGVVLISKAYADKLGFSGNYDAFLGKKVTLQTRQGYSGEGSQLTPPPQCGPGQPGGGNCGPNQGQSPATELQATVVGVTSDDNPVMYIPMSWARGILTMQMYQPVQQTQGNCVPGRPCQPQPQQFQLCTYKPFTSTPPASGCPANQGGGQGNSYSSLVVRVDQASNADAVAALIRPLGVGAVSAQSFIQQQLNLFNVISLVFGGIGGIALLVAAIGVVNTMVMAILERTREIGVLRACGATRRTIRQLFTVEASTLGFIGGALGVAGGFGLTLIANNVINKQLTTNSVSASNIITVPVWLIVTVIAATTVIGMLAGLIPAYRAARLDPVDALRHE
jgi:ABC-type lipoprotein release transport system permease subunit